MKKVILLLALMISLIVTGCSSNEKTETEDVVKNVYCDSCGDESKEVTKFCSNCGEEAKWLAEKPNTEEVENDNDENNKTEDVKEEVIKVEKDQCGNCGKYFSKTELKKFYEGLLCNKCYNLPKNCENGFQGLCEGCIECDPTSYSDFTGEKAISIAEKYYNSKGDGDTYYEYNTEAESDSKGIYYTVIVKSKSMLKEGGNGTLFAIKVYDDGTVVE